MAVLDIRRRTGYLFLALTVGHIILVSAQVTTDREVPVLEQVSFGLMAEVQRGAYAVVGGVASAWDHYVALRGVNAENERLRTELTELRVQLQQERALAQQSRALEDLLDLRSRSGLSTASATIIGGAASPEFRTVTIDRGVDDGVVADMAVVAAAGVVGRVITPGPRAAKVQLLIDRNAAAGALVERSRAQGVIEGAGADLRLTYVAETADVRAGDVVVTSGIDGIYPKGFVIGQIESVERGVGVIDTIRVRPAVDFSTLEVVLVVLDPPPAAGSDAARTDAGRAPE